MTGDSEPPVTKDPRDQGDVPSHPSYQTHIRRALPGPSVQTFPPLGPSFEDVPCAEGTWTDTLVGVSPCPQPPGQTVSTVTLGAKGRVYQAHRH